MKLSKYLALLLVVGVAAIACQAAPDETSEAVAEAPAAAEPAAAAEQPQSRERPEPNAPQVEGAELAAMLADADILLLDVRTAEELEEHGTIEGYLHIPIGELADRLDEVPRDKPILTA